MFIIFESDTKVVQCMVLLVYVRLQHIVPLGAIGPPRVDDTLVFYDPNLCKVVDLT